MTAATGTRGRPRLYRSYEAELALLNTPAKRRWTGALLIGAVVAGLRLPDDLAFLLATAFVAAIGAIGLNLVTGYTGQISLGHGALMAVGALAAISASMSSPVPTAASSRKDFVAGSYQRRTAPSPPAIWRARSTTRLASRSGSRTPPAATATS